MRSFPASELGDEKCVIDTRRVQVLGQRVPEEPTADLSDMDIVLQILIRIEEECFNLRASSWLGCDVL